MIAGGQGPRLPPFPGYLTCVSWDALRHCVCRRDAALPLETRALSC